MTNQIFLLPLLLIFKKKSNIDFFCNIDKNCTPWPIENPASLMLKQGLLELGSTQPHSLSTFLNRITDLHQSNSYHFEREEY